MGACTKPCSVPGSETVALAPPVFGVVTFTYCLACSALPASRALALEARLHKVRAPPITRIASTTSITICARRITRRSCSGMADRLLDDEGRRMPRAAAGERLMDATEHDRHEEQRRDGREDEAADDGAAERGILLRALADAQ